MDIYCFRHSDTWTDTDLLDHGVYEDKTSVDPSVSLETLRERPQCRCAAVYSAAQRLYVYLFTQVEVSCPDYVGSAACMERSIHVDMGVCILERTFGFLYELSMCQQYVWLKALRGSDAGEISENTSACTRVEMTAGLRNSTG